MTTTGYLGVSIVTPAAAEPITLADAKAHLRVTHNEEDDYITGLLTVCRRWLEDECGRCLMLTTLLATWEMFPTRAILSPVGLVPMAGQGSTELSAMRGYAAFTLPRSPVRQVTGITYLDDNDDLQTVDPTTYRLDNSTDPSRVIPKSDQVWPVIIPKPGAVRIQFTAGADDANGVDSIAKHAIKLLCSQLYEFREPEVTSRAVQQVRGLQNLISLIRVQTAV